MRKTAEELTNRILTLAKPLALPCVLLSLIPQQYSCGAEGTPPMPAFNSRVDAAVHTILARTGLPSASIALVRDSAVVYTQAYGLAQLTPPRPATPAMRYALGSISKEFTAAALLLLQESGKVSLDDSAGKWVSGMGPAASASIRSLLSHTSGIRDFWPQDYDPPEMSQAIEPQEIVARWANQPLDFETGSSWQYSNTGYTVAGIIAERAAGKPLFGFLQERIFKPLQMTTVVDFDAQRLSMGDATGYMRYALGPPRPAAKEGRGWLFAAGELAMTASDLARWDIALLERKVLNNGSLRALTTEILLANGAGTSYALGLDVELQSGKRVLKHGGEVGGFTAENRLYPDDGVAIVVLTNEDATNASETIADALAELLFDAQSPADADAIARDRDLFKQLQLGKLPLQLLTPNARSYFTPVAVQDFRASLGALGEPANFALKRSGRRGGFMTHVYEAVFAHQTLSIVVRSTTQGLVEQFTVNAK